ncbi:MAG: polysulfide reductase NrfD [Chloroflexi bacterium]|nr:polysulfide reductase NrfD [Chloroflexota bacterium]
MSSHDGSGEFEGIDYARVTQDAIRSLTHTTWKYYVALAISFAVVVGGAIIYYHQSVVGLGIWGANEPNWWAMDITGFIWWIGFSLAGTLLSAILLLTKSDWRNPVYRLAEMMTALALITANVVVLTHIARPWRMFYIFPYPNLRQLWPSFRSPLFWDVLGLVSYLTASSLFLYIGAIPDFAAVRDHVTGWRKKLYSKLSLGWTGSSRQWRHLRRAYFLIAPLIIPIAVSMHSVTAWISSTTLNPGNHSSIYAPYFVTGALLSGSSGVIIIALLLRKCFHFEEYITMRHIDNLAKLIVVASLLMSYIYLIELFIPWIKTENLELMPVVAKLRGTYSPLYWSMIVLNSLIPLTLFFRKVRRCIPALLLISIGIEIAMYFERFLMVIPGQSIGPLPYTWGSYRPTWVEGYYVMWYASVFIFLFLLLVKIIPSVSIFEVKELLRAPKRGDKRFSPEPTAELEKGISLVVPALEAWQSQSEVGRLYGQPRSTEEAHQTSSLRYLSKYLWTRRKRGD